MPDGDHEALAEEQVHLADLDVVGLVDVPGRAQDDEQGVAVAFELGALVGGDGVLDRELGQVELVGDLVDLDLIRAQQADPGEAAALAGAFAQQREGAVEGVRAGDALAVNVEGVVHDGHDRIVAAQRASGGAS